MFSFFRDSLLILTLFCIFGGPTIALGLSFNSSSSGHLLSSGLRDSIRSKSLLWNALGEVNDGKPGLSECEKTIKKVLSGLANYEPIAIKMIDASGTIPSGLLDGTVTDFGDYDECLSLRSNAGESELKFKGKHCILKAKPVLDEASRNLLKGSWMLVNNFSLHIGLCIPNTCSNHEILPMLTKALNSSFQFEEKLYCDEAKELTQIAQLTSSQLLSIMYLVAMVLLVSSLTVYDGFMRLKQGKMDKTVSNISAITATIDLLTLRGDRFGMRKASIDVMRLVWVIIIIAAHSSFGGIEPLLIAKVARLDADFAKFFQPIYMQPFFNAAVIEGFFYIGGFLTYLSIHDLIEKKVSLVSSAFNRYLRFAPGMLSIMALEQIWPIIATGPMVSEVRDNVYRNCERNWWKNLIFFNNFDRLTEMCLTHTWYISADFQLFILAVVVIGILNSHKKTGILLIYTIIATGMIFTGWVAFNESHVPAIILANKDWGFLDFIDYSYLPTTPHMTPYFMGILVAYYERNKIRVLSKTTRKLLWVVCPVVFAAVTFMPSLWNTFKLNPDSYYSAVIYLTFYRFFWTAAFAWGLLVLVKFVLKMVKKLQKIQIASQPSLTQPEGQPVIQIVSFLLGVARLHFSLYLVHALYVRWFWSVSRGLLPYSFFDIFERTSLLTLMSVLVSFLFYIFFESPFENLRRNIFSKNAE
ncbi:nose resistant to fluoxetine protein 6-like isoform X2 [Brevipalpus obovatus]|uniref:nose resistant to fluoxetine protein 6-like isoform X2 n=1 Tax=Brevipalpus obovatus TaxID=246614 RepID=UPI003D9E55BC